MTSRVFYPHGIVAYDDADAELFNITQLSDLSPMHNFEDLSEQGASEVGPQFTGTHQGSPEIPFTTTQIKTILDACVGGRHNLAVDLSAGNVDVFFKSGQLLNDRYPDDEEQHLRARLQDNSMLCWESLSARQGALAELSCRLLAVYNSQTGNDPMVFAAAQELPVPSEIAALFTLGPLKLNGSFVSGVTEWRLENNIEYEKEASDGEPFHSYKAIKEYRPVLTARTRDARVLATYGTRGTALTSMYAFLRMKLASGINIPDATATNLQISSVGGTIKARQIQGADAVAEITVDLMLDGNSPAYEIDTTAQIV